MNRNITSYIRLYLSKKPQSFRRWETRRDSEQLLLIHIYLFNYTNAGITKTFENPITLGHGASTEQKPNPSWPNQEKIKIRLVNRHECKFRYADSNWSKQTFHPKTTRLTSIHIQFIMWNATTVYTAWSGYFPSYSPLTKKRNRDQNTPLAKFLGQFNVES